MSDQSNQYAAGGVVHFQGSDGSWFELGAVDRDSVPVLFETPAPYVIPAARTLQIRATFTDVNRGLLALLLNRPVPRTARSIRRRRCKLRRKRINRRRNR